MRYFYLYLLLLSCVPGLAQTADTTNCFPKKEQANPPIRIRCRAFVTDAQPLFIIDGEPVMEQSIRFINPNDIDSVTVLKDERATALYGSRGVNGVVIIGTKNSCFRSFSALDGEDNAKLAGATFTFTAIDGSDSRQLIADENGMVFSTTFPIGRKYHLLISSVGYRDLKTVYTREKDKIIQHYKLSRDVKENVSVIVPSVTRCILRRTPVCGGVRLAVDDLPAKPPMNEMTLPAGRLFPNPVNRGGMVKLEMDIQKETPFQVKLTNTSGATLSMFPYQPIKGMNRLEIPVAAQWTAGVYFVQVISQQGKLLKQEKLIIQ